MLQLSTTEVKWENLFDLWNEISFERGLNPSFNEIVVLESAEVEGIVPCEGYDWLPVLKLKSPVKPKKRTVTHSYGKYLAHIPHASKASLETLSILIDHCKDFEVFTAIAMLATARQLLAELPRHWRGENYSYLSEVSICCVKRIGWPYYYYVWPQSTKWFFPEGYYSKELIEAVHRIDSATFVEFSLCNLAFYCDAYRPAYYLQNGVDDIDKFRDAVSEVGLAVIPQIEIEDGCLSTNHANALNQIERIERDIKNYNKPFAHREGRLIEKRSIAYERSSPARKACLQHYGCECAVCGRDFGRDFGNDFSGIIEVHHLEPLALSKGNRKTDPVKDLVPVCPNCHRMLHWRSGRPYSPEQLKAIMKNSPKML